MAGTSRVDRGRYNVYWTCCDTSFITFYTSSLYLHFLQYSTDRRQNIIKCCLDHKTSVRARRRLFIIVYKYFIPSAMILSNIKYFSNLPPRISISLKINMSGWWWWWWGAVVTSASNWLVGEVVQSRRRLLLGPSPGWKRLLALSHLRHY